MADLNLGGLTSRGTRDATVRAAGRSAPESLFRNSGHTACATFHIRFFPRKLPAYESPLSFASVNARVTRFTRASTVRLVARDPRSPICSRIEGSHFVNPVSTNGRAEKASAVKITDDFGASGKLEIFLASDDATRPGQWRPESGKAPGVPQISRLTQVSE